MMHARVAFYRLQSGTFDEVVRRVEAAGGLLEIFRGRPGFQSYERGEAADCRQQIGRGSLPEAANGLTARRVSTTGVDFVANLQRVAVIDGA
jgi:hypothetical protein